MKKIFLLPILCSLAFVACKPELLVTPSEPTKGLSGSWQIIKATRNGTDLTTRFDFSRFRINFTDSSYTIDSLVPFIVSRNGKWSFDDPTFPFSLSFQPTDSSARTSPLQYPVTGGQRNLIISFSPGCSLNTYQYTLQKAN
ncbi:MULTISPECIES: DUF5004 domain-containing protein [Niastella]|uniref:DUF5004 domain-containing protein n=1 Tax=Niastella soli TaxID=2821487 RepID=A0ABS3YX24_9BACT|nr:DUF5004 domain-containing protein [Niastella soli]MBO9202462.1 DUF5004 domain-containing protein [Niastella soli]